MILVDSSIWIDHLRRGDPVMTELLDAGSILGHPFVIGEVSLGSLHRRQAVLTELRRLPGAAVARDPEVQMLIEREKLYGIGIGYGDARTLLAATLLTSDAKLWTRDRRLRDAAARLRLSYEPVN